MSCINVSVHHLKTELSLRYSKNDGINARIEYIPTNINISSELLNIFTASTYRINSGELSVTLGMVCLMPGVSGTIEWEKDRLIWSFEEHSKGIIQYNTLRAGQSWKLEEMIFEEIF